jgi:type I restriction enzyme S subunit
MELTAGYKQTDAGVIPEDWDTQPIRDLVDRVRLGGNYPNSERASSLPLIKMGNMGRGNIVIARLEYVPDGFPVDEQHRLRLGDVLFNTRNTLDLVGKVCIWRNELQLAYYNSNLLRLEFLPRRLSNYFANYVLNSHGSILRLREIATGTTSVAAIYTRDLLEFRVVTPPLPEQHAIAIALSDVDELIASLDALITKKRDLKQATMQQLLTGKTRLPGFTGKWEVKRLGRVADIRNEKIETLGADVASFCVELEQIGQNTGLINGHSDARGRRSVKYRFEQGDVLFGRLRPYLRKFWWADRAGVCSTEIWPLIPIDGQLVADFLFQVVQTDAFIEAADSSYGTHMPRSDWNALTKFEILMPSDPAEQTAIATVLSDMDSELVALEAKCDKARALKRGMMQELLTGRIRLG